MFFLRRKGLILLIILTSILSITITLRIASNFVDQETIGYYEDGLQSTTRMRFTTIQKDGDYRNHHLKHDEHHTNNHDDEQEDEYRLPLRETTNKFKLEFNHTNSMVEPVQILHRGVSGLGHRLKWMSTAHHLVKTMNLTNGLFTSWGWECGGTKEDGSPMDIFYYLFGTDVLPITPLLPDAFIYSPTLMRTIQKIKESPANPTTREDVKELRFVNELPKIYDIVTPNLVQKNKLPQEVMRQKVRYDFEMYTQLRSLYQQNDIARDFMRENQYRDHYVFGLHIRAGNGETGHFQENNREITDLEKWLDAFTSMMVDFVSSERYMQMANGKKPLLFVATDTPKSIDLLKMNVQTAARKRNMSFPVIHFPQEYMKEGKGVSFKRHFETTDRCYQSWSDQFMDMTLLSASDVIIAGQFSAFTQSIPLITALADPDPLRRRKLFCEVGLFGDVMECMGNYTEWYDVHYMDKTSSIALIGNETSVKQIFQSRQLMPVYEHRPRRIRDLVHRIDALFQ